MKKKKDIGLEYLRQLGIRPAKNRDGVLKQLQAVWGAETGKSVWNRIGEESDVQKLYREKNRDLKTSVTISGAYDGELYREACNWIAAHRSFFGKTILEVGCDCGILSCFLGQQFPDATIFAIDRTEEAIPVARQLADRLGVTNIVFQHAALEDLEEKTYDTVFSMRTVHENVAQTEIQPTYQPLLKQAELYSNTIAAYAEPLLRKISTGGMLVSIERGEKNPMFLGWLFHMQAAGLSVLPESYQELYCTILGDACSFQALSAEKNPERQGNVYEFWCRLFPQDTTTYRYTGWEAETIWQNILPQLERLVAGYEILTEEGILCGKYVVWTWEGHPEAVWYYQGGETTTVGVYEAALLPAIQEQMADLRRTCLQQGLRVEAIVAKKEKCY